MNKLYSVQYLNYTTDSCTIVGLFRDENIATTFQNDKNKEEEAKALDRYFNSNGCSTSNGYYVVKPLYTDF